MNIKNKKQQKAFSLVEIIILLMISCVILVITTPFMTTKEATKRCSSGGHEIFEVTYDATTGRKHVHEFIPQSHEIYVTSVGGGGGGSGAIIVETSCKDIYGSNSYDPRTCKCYTGAKVIKKKEKKTITESFSESEFEDIIKPPNKGFYTRTDYCNKYTDTDAHRIYFTCVPSEIIQNKKCHQIDVDYSTEDCQNDHFVNHLCYTSTNYQKNKCCEDEQDGKLNNAIIGGAGGMGGYFSFGAKANISGQEIYLNNHELSKPIKVHQGKKYHVIIGIGGSGGEAKITSINPDKSITLATEYLSGISGTSSCIVDYRYAENNPTVNMDNVTCHAIPTEYKLVEVLGGAGAVGNLGGIRKTSTTLATSGNIRETVYGYPISPTTALPFMTTSPFGHINLDQSENATPFYNKGIIPDSSKPGSIGLHTLTIGGIGSFTSGGRGGASLFGAGKNGAGGDGGFGYYSNKASYDTEEERKNLNGSKGHDGIVDIKWYSICK